ncbi:ATP:ADP antiporter, AAA family [Nematocida homosporus]|uniref:ATP:ADP antiporter, AAA family n=1 Tax=Nematocida homosporus TaxID=1912981 RepID=UPI00221F31E5|nr:ATP:ADP antiporter, AAA family [Nematocida homosporus]KAI5185064.1 ATP:ADP antiporter, AAA family [Nematocida homosporus]
MQTGLTSDYRSRSLPTEEAHEEATESCSGFFRVLRVEYAKFFTMATLYFLIVLAYSILRDTKDVVVIGRMLPASIQYLKSFVVMGATMTFAVFFQYLLAKGVSLERMMFSFNIGFGVFFVVYAFLLLPNMERIEPYKYWINDIFADKKMYVNGLEFLQGLLLTVNFWTGTLLYTAAELWGNIMTSVMFFAVANEVCPLRQALRFYPLFIIGANLGLVSSGSLMVGTSFILDWYADWTFVIISALLSFVAVICAVNVMLYRHLVKNIIPYPIYIVFESSQKRASKKEKVGFLDGFKIMFKTPIVFHLSMTVLGYGICTNLTEGAYKSALKMAAAKDKGSGEMTAIMRTQGLQQINIGGAVILVLLSPLKTFIQKHGWLSLGLLTPVLTLVAGLAFLLFVWANVSVSLTKTEAQANFLLQIGRSIFTGISWQAFIEGEKWVGFFAVNTIKILKYAAFDVGKEAIGVKIPKQYRARFKGVYDGVFGKLGKSFASGLQIGLSAFVNSVDIRTAALALIIGLTSMASAWTYSTIYLGRKYDEAVREDRDIQIGEVPSKAEKAAKAGEVLGQ